MTDIVERLRTLQQLAESDKPFSYVKDIFGCAADEIERLRAFIAGLDGKYICIQADDGFIDDGFIVASDVLEPKP